MRTAVILPNQEEGKWDQEDNMSDTFLSKGEKLA